MIFLLFIQLIVYLDYIFASYSNRLSDYKNFRFLCVAFNIAHTWHQVCSFHLYYFFVRIFPIEWKSYSLINTTLNFYILLFTSYFIVISCSSNIRNCIWMSIGNGCIDFRVQSHYSSIPKSIVCNISIYFVFTCGCKCVLCICVWCRLQTVW